MVRCHPLATVYLALVIGLAPPISHSNERCVGATLNEATSLAALPDGVRRLLASMGNGFDGIADKGGRFNATDVVDHNVPMRRFILAAVGATCAVVAIEHGGLAHNFEVREYQVVGSAWQLTSHATVFNEPRSVADLVVVRLSP
jgi:hypothetical protein